MLGDDLPPAWSLRSHVSLLSNLTLPVLREAPACCGDRSDRASVQGVPPPPSRRAMRAPPRSRVVEVAIQPCRTATLAREEPSGQDSANGGMPFAVRVALFRGRQPSGYESNRSCASGRFLRNRRPR